MTLAVHDKVEVVTISGNSIFDPFSNVIALISWLPSSPRAQVAIVEIYNERIRDLLSREKESVKIREGASGVYLEEATGRRCLVDR